MIQTLENLSKAFSGEGIARNRYTIYSKIAMNEWFDQVGEIFLLTADNEREHAKWILRMINDIKTSQWLAMDEISVEISVPNTLWTTIKNLESSIEWEEYEFLTMYPEFAETAKKEGFPEIAARLNAIAIAENHHKQRFEKLLNQIENETFFKKEENTSWMCRKCGYMHTWKTPPAKCPSCNHETAYFQIICENY